MQALTDTHTFLWWALDDPGLSAPCRRIISDPDNTIFFSVASAWEISIKYQIGKLPLPEPPDIFLPARLEAGGFRVLTATLQHIIAIRHLPLIHRDPFDRLLVAQAQIENLPILTTDETIRQYAVQTIW